MTFSVVATDPGTGECGVAVASCVLAVGRAVPWARAGVGVVATQSRTRRGYGPHSLAGLEAGVDPAEVLGTLLARDAGAEHRQVAVLAADGRVAVHTGAACLPVAGHLSGDGWAVQGNTLGAPEVLPAMAEAISDATADARTDARADAAAGAGAGATAAATTDAGPGTPAGARRPLAERLVAALAAGERAGGDLRGRQSAALLVVGGPVAGHAGGTDGSPDREPWDAVPVDLRVDDASDPVGALGRLLYLQRAYENDDSATLGLLAPSGPRELHAALSAARRGDAQGARAALAALREQPGWDGWLRANLTSGRMPYLAELLDRG